MNDKKGTIRKTFSRGKYNYYLDQEAITEEEYSQILLFKRCFCDSCRYREAVKALEKRKIK